MVSLQEQKPEEVKGLDSPNPQPPVDSYSPKTVLGFSDNEVFSESGQLKVFLCQAKSDIERVRIDQSLRTSSSLLEKFFGTGRASMRPKPNASTSLSECVKSSHSSSINHINCLACGEKTKIQAETHNLDHSVVCTLADDDNSAIKS